MFYQFLARTIRMRSINSYKLKWPLHRGLNLDIDIFYMFSQCNTISKPKVNLAHAVTLE